MPGTTYFLYRLAGGEYLASSTTPFSRPIYSGHREVVDPPISSGIDWELGGVMWDGAEFRNASPAEIQTMKAAEEAEIISIAKDTAKESCLTDRKIQALLAFLVQELNVTRSEEDPPILSLGAVKDRINTLIDEG